MRQLASVGFACFALLLTHASFGQNVAVVNRPALKIGDSWTYSTRDTRYGRPASHLTLAVSTVAPNKITFSWQEAPGDKRGTFVVNRDLNPLEWRGPGTYVYHAYPFDPVYKFPLKAGETWAAHFRYTRPGKKYKDAVHETVSAMGKVTVPAGTFNAYKIVEQHDYAGSNGYRNWKGTAKDVRWYAPRVKNYVKKEFFDYSRSNPGPVVDELLKYSLH